MTVVDVGTAVGKKPQPKRDRWSRYVIPHPETGKEQAWTRATTLAATLADKFGLERWSQRMTALGLTQRHDLYARVASTPPDDKDTLDRLVDEAKEAAAASAGANIGTALHTFTERLDRGEVIDAPAPWNADLAAYRATLDDYGVTIVDGMIEQIVVVPEVTVAGTFDRMLAAPSWPLSRIGDLKTGGFLPWGEIALQLALYARASTIWDLITEQHRPMPTVDQNIAIVIHLPAGQATCTLYEVDIAAGWEAVQLAYDVQKWRKRKDLARSISIPHLVPVPTPVPVVPVGPAPNPDSLKARVQTIIDAGHAQTLVRLWPLGLPTLKQGGHNDDQLRQIARLCGDVEREHSLPFPADDTPARVVDLFSPLLSEPQTNSTPHRPVGPHDLLRRELEDLGQPEAKALLVATCGEHKAYPAITEQEWDTLALLVLAIDRGAVAIVYDDRGATAVTTDQAHPLLVAVHGTPAAALAAARQIAEMTGRKSPRSVASAANDPVLTAHLIHLSQHPSRKDFQP